MFSIAIIVLSNILQLTWQYFNFPSQIKITIKEDNYDDKLPRITLNAELWPEFYYLMKFVDSLNCTNYNEFIETESKSDYNEFEYQFIECYKPNAKDILNQRRFNEVFSKYEYRFITSDYIYGLNDMQNKIKGFYFFHDGSTLPTLILTFDLNKIVNQSKNDPLIRINFKFIKDASLILNEFSLHWQPVTKPDEMNNIIWKKVQNFRLLLTKTLSTYLGPPYSQCSHYRSDTDRPFNALSHMQCYRHCLRRLAQNDKHLNCTPFFIDSMISDLDLLDENKIFCNYSMMKNFKMKLNKEFSKKCHDICPNDCFTIDLSYSQQITHSELEYRLENANRSEVSIVWDRSQPMLSYIEESVLSFTDYLINCGGLLGLWFGTNANDLFGKIIKSKILFKLCSQFKILSRQLVHYVVNY